MPYRVRPIRWDLLTGPVSQGLRTEARANEGLAQNILGGLVGVGQGIRQKKVDAESKRRSDRDFGLRKKAFDLRKGEFEAKKREAEGDLALLVDASIASAAAIKADPNDQQAKQTFSQLVHAMKGEERAQWLTTERAKGCGGPGQPT